MAWIEIIGVILPASCFTSLAVILLTLLRSDSQEYEPLSGSQGGPSIPGT